MRKKTTKKKLYVIVRAKDSGVHVGTLLDDGVKSGWVVLENSRRIWYWAGASTIDEIAVYGLNPERAHHSKIAVSVPRKRIRYSDVCEIVECEAAGRASIDGIPPWRA
jgi:hypothetical protein